MSDFNYEKAFFLFAKPAIEEKLNKLQRETLNNLLPLVKDLSQNSKLNIPIDENIQKILSLPNSKELAELSQASNFYGHWKPSGESLIFDNSQGQSWKITNVIDQELRARFGKIYPLEIHDGRLRVTFSSKDCWLWDEFALATEDNIKTFKECNLPFDGNSLSKSAEILRKQINDIWDTNNMPDIDSYNNYYKNYLAKCKKEQYEEIEKELQADLDKADQSKLDAEKEYNAKKWLLDNEVNIALDNVIYYSHTNIFSFGWCRSLNNKEQLTEQLSNFPYNWEYSKK